MKKTKIITLFLLAFVHCKSIGLTNDKISYDFPIHQENIKKIERSLAKSPLFKGIDIKNITENGLSNVYNVEMINGQSFKIDSSGNYLIKGDIFLISDSKLLLTDSFKQASNASILSVFDEKNLIVYKGINGGSKKVFVFVDYTCPFCFKFHSNEIENLNNNDVDVVLLPFPRTGNKKILKNLINIFCLPENELKKEELSKAYQQKENYNLDYQCDKEIYYTNLMSLGIDFEIHGTPAIFSENGKYIGGSMTAKELLERL